MNTKLKAILGLASISLLIYTTYEQNKTINSQKLKIDILESLTTYEQNKTIDSQKFEINALKKSIERIDSAASVQYDELFETQAQLGRYQMTLELLKEQDKPAAKKFKHILENETE
jgi:hypothetical protein